MLNMLLHLLGAFCASLYEYCLYRMQNIVQITRLMLHKETIAVYYENQRKKYAEFLVLTLTLTPRF